MSKQEHLIVEETGKLSPDDPSLEMVDAPRLNKKAIKALFVGLGGVVLIGLMWSLTEDTSPGSGGAGDRAAGQEGQQRFGVTVPSWLRDGRDFTARAGTEPVQEEPADTGEIADLRRETVVYEAEPTVFHRDAAPTESRPSETPAPTQTTQTPTAAPAPQTTPAASPVAIARTTAVVESGPSQEEVFAEQARTAGMFYDTRAGAGAPMTVSTPVTGAGSDMERVIQASLDAQSATDYERQNQQRQKDEWLASRRADFSGYVQATATFPIAPGQELKAGSVIPITMITGINSDLPGDIVAQVIEDVYDTVTGQRILIPRGSRVLGSYDSAVAFGQDRVLIAWDRIIRPDGVSLSIQGMQGVDRGGQSGLADQVDFHLDDIALSVAASSTFHLGSGALISWLSSVDRLGPISELLGSSGNAAEKIVEEYAVRVLNRQPTIVIRPGIRGNVFVSRDLVFPVYEDWRGGFQ